MDQLTLDFPSGAELRDLGIAAVSDSEPRFVTVALGAIGDIPSGVEFDAEGLRSLLPRHVATGVHPNAWGAAIRTASMAGLIEPTGGFVLADRASAHRRVLRMWRRT